MWKPTFWLRCCAFFPDVFIFFPHCLYLALSCIFRCYIIVCQGEAQWNKCTGYNYLIIYCLPHRLQQINIFMRTQNISAEKYWRLLVCWVVGFSETFKRIAIYFIIHYDGTVNGFEYHPGSLMCRFSVSLACICILGVHMIFTEIIRIKMRQNILYIYNIHTKASEKLKLNWWDAESSRFGLFGSHQCDIECIQHTATQWYHKFVSCTQTHAPSAKLSIPRKFVSVLWK